MGAAVMLGGSVWAPSARADVIDFFLDNDNLVGPPVLLHRCM